MYDDYYFQKKKFEQHKRENKQRYIEGSKRRLMNIIDKKLHTTMIGALSYFESNFGYLWGHGKQGDLTKDEENFAKVWEFVRKEILNNGNNQLRACLEELSQYDIRWNRYHTDFIIKGNQK